jgi:hypothetical protein
MVVDRLKANRDVLAACAVLGAFFVVVAAGAYAYTLDWHLPFPRDGTTLVVGRDFLNFWMYGRAASSAHPGAWYDPHIYNTMLAALLGGNYPGQNWSYPPTLMLLMAPFARLGYLPALALWTALGLAIFVPVIWRYVSDWRALVAVLCSPAAVFGIISGQISFLTTALMIGAFMWLDRRPIAAGVLIGALTLKPHLGVLFPIVLAVSRRWTVFASAAITALGLAAISVLLFGVTPWADYVGIGLPVQNIVLSDPNGIATPFYPTLFMNLRGIGLPYGAAMAAQASLAVVAITIAAWSFRNRANEPRTLVALFFACSLSALPYMLAYDTLALCVAALALLADGTLDARGRWLARLIYWLPLLQIGLGTLHVPGPALIAPAFALCLFMRLYSAERTQALAALRAT